MALTSYQGQSNGLTFGPGTDVQLVQIDGLRDTTGVQSGDAPMPRRRGTAAGANFMGARVLTLTFMVFAPSVPFEQVLSAITAAFQPTSDPASQQLLSFMLPGWASPRQVWGRTTQGAIPIDNDYQFNKGTVALQFTCNDPLVYDSVQQVVSTTLPSPTAGLTFPASTPFVFGASSGGSFQIVNTGNTPGPLLVEIDGPATNPVLQIGSQYLGFNIALGASDVLQIDTNARTATLNGTASRTGTIMAGSTWLEVPPGSCSVGVSSSDSSAVAALFTGRFRSTWGFM